MSTEPPASVPASILDELQARLAEGEALVAELRDRALRAEGRAAGLLQVLEEYGQHLLGCEGAASGDDDETVCSCGWAAAWSECVGEGRER